MTEKREVQKEIQIHGVIVEEGSTLLECHTHGLEKFNHSNFSVMATSLFKVSAMRLLNSLGDAVINEGEIFKANENCEWGEWGRFILTEGKDSGDEPVLKIIPYSPECEACKEKEE